MIFGWSGSELLLYGGIFMMAAAILAALLSIVIYIRTGKKLKKKLAEEYGELQR